MQVIAFDESGTQHDQSTVNVDIHHQGETCTNLPLQLLLPESNPALGKVMFSYSIPNAAATSRNPVQLTIFDTRGRRMATVFSGNNKPGAGTIQWDGRGTDGTQAVSGVYYAVLSFGSERIAEKFVYLR